ncbi:MAG: hypothetical protein ACI9WL_000348 [Rubritalea sp.]|jgi:hypothetical protein
MENMYKEVLLSIKMTDGIATRIGGAMNASDLVHDEAKDSKKRCE